VGDKEVEMVTLVLSSEEARELAQLLDARLREMRMEIANTFDRAYRDDLRAQHDRLEDLQKRLQERPPDEVYV
jgi:predicted outer membrane protein